MSPFQLMDSLVDALQWVEEEINNTGKIGCLGDIPFVVSAYKIQTIDNAVWSGSARYGTHQRHLYHAMVEYEGMDPDSFSFDMTLYKELGAPPITLLNKLWDYERKGTPLSLCIGEKGYGKYQWVIKSHSTKMEATDREGNLILATVSVELMEYLWW